MKKALKAVAPRTRGCSAAVWIGNKQPWALIGDSGRGREAVSIMQSGRRREEKAPCFPSALFAVSHIRLGTLHIWPPHLERGSTKNRTLGTKSSFLQWQSIIKLCWLHKCMPPRLRDSCLLLPWSASSRKLGPTYSRVSFPPSLIVLRGGIWHRVICRQTDTDGLSRATLCRNFSCPFGYYIPPWGGSMFCRLCLSAHVFLPPLFPSPLIVHNPHLPPFLWVTSKLASLSTEVQKKLVVVVKQEPGGQFNWISTDCSTGFSTEYSTLSSVKSSVEHPVEQLVEIQLNWPPGRTDKQGQPTFFCSSVAGFKTWIILGICL